ncbi:MAG TPA: hypothetical protein VGF89_14590 [Steroidobacteraceae bacterium]|jgi:hypothetical protein
MTPGGRIHHRSAIGWVLAVALAASQSASPADADPCTGFSWDMTRVRTLFASAPQSLQAGRDAQQAPPLSIARLYELQLAPQTQTHPALPPGKHSDDQHSFAGLARLQLEHAGNYRISLDRPGWIDVVAGSAAIDSSGFQGRPGCSAPHKSVQFALPAHQALLLQFSAVSDSQLRVTITPAE